MLVVVGFTGMAADFAERAERALSVLAGRDGFVRGRLGRSTDAEDRWVLVTEWVGAGAWRRALSSYEVKVQAAPLLGLGDQLASAYEILASSEGGELVTSVPDLAPDAGDYRPGR